VKTLARAEDRDEILRRLRALRPENERRWGRMSVHQMVCHLADAFRMATGDKAASDASSVLHRTVVKWVALYAPVRWPPGITTRPEIDQECGGTAPADFASDVACVQAMVERISLEAATLSFGVHPIFGRLSAASWLRWGYLHVDHHLRQFDA